MEALKAALWLNGASFELDDLEPASGSAASTVSTQTQQQQQPIKREDGEMEWDQELGRQPDLVEAEGWQHFLAMRIEKETAMKVHWRHQLGDHMHMAKALKRAGLIQHSRYYFSVTGNIVHGIYSFSKEAVSHPSIVHGGAQFFVMDECCGQLAFLVLPGGALTAHCDLKFLRPFPVDRRTCIVTAEVESVEGRKALLRASLRESPSGPAYAEIKALYFRVPEKSKIKSAL